MQKPSMIAWLGLVLMLVLAACGGQQQTAPVEQE